MTLDQAIALFIHDRTQRGCGIHAIKSYTQHLGLLSKFLTHPTIESLTAEQLNCYLTQLTPSHSPISVRQRATAIKTFLKWSYTQHYITCDTLQQFHIPKRPHTLPKAASLEQIKNLVSAECIPTRERAMIFLMLDAGLRRAETADLTLDNLDLNRSVAFIRNGKGNKQRYVIFAETTCKTLIQWIQERKAQDTDNHVFVTKHGIDFQPGGIYKAIKRATQHAGLFIQPHRLRHTFATSYLDRGGNIHDLQALMGHESITTTMQYVSVSLDKMRQRHKQLSLLDNL